MSKVLVDRELLERIVNTNMADYAVIAYQRKEIRFILEAQPAEAEGVSNARLMNTLAELARRAPLRTLHTICETQRQVSTVKLERYLEPVGDTLAGYAFTLRIDFDKLSAALSAVTAERDGLAAARMAYANEFAPDENGDPDVGNVHANIRALKAERDRLLKDAERYLWASSGVHEAETLVSIVNCHGGYAEKVAERVDVYREADMDAKEAEPLPTCSGCGAKGWAGNCSQCIPY